MEQVVNRALQALTKKGGRSFRCRNDVELKEGEGKDEFCSKGGNEEVGSECTQLRMLYPKREKKHTTRLKLRLF